MPAAAALRARAEAAPRLYGRERLTAIAAIRDGSSLRAIAKELRHAPSQILAWLDEGVRVGLEAMLVPPPRPSFPPDAPADIAAITSWLAGVYRPSFGFRLWTVDNLTAAEH